MEMKLSLLILLCSFMCLAYAQKNITVPVSDESFARPRVIKISTLPGAIKEMVIVGQEDGQIYAAPFTASSMSSNVTVAAQGFSFVPSQIVVSVGSCVTWTNLNLGHNVVQVSDNTSIDPTNGGFKSGEPGALAEFTRCFDQPGSYFYICQAHISNGMRGVVLVVGDSNATRTKQLIASLGFDQFPTGSEAALVGLELHPDFMNNGLFWVAYSAPISVVSSSTGSSTQCVETNCVTPTVDHMLLVDEYIIPFEQGSTASSSNQLAKFNRRLLQLACPFAGNNGLNTLIFDEISLRLYLSLGDGGDTNDPLNNALNPDSLFGKIWSLDISLLNATTDSCNITLNKVSALKSLCSWLSDAMTLEVSGIRNPVGLAIGFSTELQVLMMTDHGLSVDEIQLMPINLDSNETTYFGWNLVDGGKCVANETATSMSGAFDRSLLGPNLTSILPIAEGERSSPGVLGLISGILIDTNSSSDVYYLIQQEPAMLMFLTPNATVIEAIDFTSCLRNSSTQFLPPNFDSLQPISVGSGNANIAHALGTTFGRNRLFIALGDTETATIYEIDLSSLQ